MQDFIRGGTPTEEAWFILDAGTEGNTRLTAEIENYESTIRIVRERLKAACAEMGLPEFKSFYLERKGDKVTNLSIFFAGMSGTQREMRERFPMVDGRGSRDGSFKFREKSVAQKQFAELMDGCPPSPDSRDIFRRALVTDQGGFDIALANPGLTRLEDGRYLLTSREGYTSWNEAIQASGGRRLSKAEALRVQADHAEAEAAKKDKQTA